MRESRSIQSRVVGSFVAALPSVSSRAWQHLTSKGVTTMPRTITKSPARDFIYYAGLIAIAVAVAVVLAHAFYVANGLT